MRGRPSLESSSLTTTFSVFLAVIFVFTVTLGATVGPVMMREQCFFFCGLLEGDRESLHVGLNVAHFKNARFQVCSQQLVVSR